MLKQESPGFKVSTGSGAGVAVGSGLVVGVSGNVEGEITVDEVEFVCEFV